jgi:hypothetical protein
MKVLDLTCEHQHRFEGWFQSADDYESQRSRRLIECPVCSSNAINRVPSAPRLNLSGATAPAAPDTARPPADPAVAEIQARWLKAVRKVIENTEDVGTQFAEEARRIHYHEAPARDIRGVTTPDDARALAEEGIDVMTLPMPAALKKPLQ